MFGTDELRKRYQDIVETPRPLPGGKDSYVREIHSRLLRLAIDIGFEILDRIESD